MASGNILDMVNPKVLANFTASQIPIIASLTEKMPALSLALKMLHALCQLDFSWLVPSQLYHNLNCSTRLLSLAMYFLMIYANLLPPSSSRNAQINCDMQRAPRCFVRLQRR